MSSDTVDEHEYIEGDRPPEVPYGHGSGFIADKEKWMPLLKRLQDSITFMIAEERVTGADGASYLVPSWGTTGMKLATTPIFAYDRDEIVRVLGDTMSTDGTHIYIYLPFMQMLMEEAEKENSYGVEITLAHEISHMLMNHIPRGSFLNDAYPHRTLNIAMDIEIDIPIYDDFNRKYPLGTWTLTYTPAYEDGKPIEKYRGLSFEEICQMLQDEADLKASEPGSGGSDNGPGDPKMMDVKNMEDLVRQLAELSQEIGDSSIMDSLVRAGILKEGDADKVKQAVDSGGNLPQNVLDGLRQLEDTSRSQSRQVIQQASELNERTGGRMPGSHSLNALVTRIRADEEIDIDYESVLSKRVKAIGDKRVTDANKMSSICYLRAQDLGLKKRMPYLPGKTMAKDVVRVAAIIDTSASMSSEGDLVDAVSALLRLSRQRNAEIYIYSVDTTIRGYPTLLTPAIIDKVKERGAELFGRGGTSLENGLRELFERNSGDDIANAIDISEGSSGKRARQAGGGLAASKLGSAKLGGARGKRNQYDLTVYISDLEDTPPNKELFTRDQLDNTILLATKRVPKNTIRSFQDAGWTTYGIGKDKRINLDKNMRP